MAHWRLATALNCALVLTACGGGGEARPPPDVSPPVVKLSTGTTTLRYEGSASVTVEVSDAMQTLTAEDFLLQGLSLVKFKAESKELYQIDVRSNVATGQATIALAAHRVSDAAGNFNATPVGVTFEIDPSPPIAYPAAYVPLTYVPESGYSYYSPGANTVNVFYSDKEPINVRATGQPFPSGMLVMVQFQKTVVSFNADAQIRWTFPSGGRFVSADGDHVFTSDLIDLKLVHVLDKDGHLVKTLHFDRQVNFVKVAGSRLVVVYNDVGPVEVYAWQPDLVLGERLFSTVTATNARSADLVGDRLAVADTFGQRVFVQSLQQPGKVLSEYSVTYPNDLVWRGDFLYVAEEHIDRIIALNTADDSKHIVMAPPTLTRWDLSMTLSTTPLEYCGSTGEHRRSVASDQCSGEFTLYAPNGLALAENGIWVADTDNSRVIYVADGVTQSVLTGLNGPVSVVPFH